MAEEINNPIFQFPKFSIQHKKQKDLLRYKVFFKCAFCKNDLHTNAKIVLETLKKNQLIDQEIAYYEHFLEEQNKENTETNTIILSFQPNIKTLTHPIDIAHLLPHKACYQETLSEDLIIINNKILSSDYLISCYYIDHKTLIVEYKSGPNISAVTNKLLPLNHRIEVFEYSNVGNFEKIQTIPLCLTLQNFSTNLFSPSMQPTINKEFNLLTVYKGCIIIHDTISNNYYCFSKPNNNNIKYQHLNK